jgi:cytosine/adenosine deaminase-related metal-dependent hydrolase
VERATLEIEAGRIAAIHARAESPARDLGNVAIIPGLVNAHTHLEFSALDAPLLPASPFTAWIRQVIAHRKTGAEKQAAVVRGYRESGASGSTTLGEIATDDWPSAQLPRVGPRTVVFRELRGPLSEQTAGQLLVAQRHLADSPADDKAIHALSPHAPYSVHPNLFQCLVALAEEDDVPLAMHLAETVAELELLESGSGEIAGMLRDLGVWRDGVTAGGTRPLEYLREMASLSHALVIHGNYLSAEEIEFLGRHPHMSIVYCPRTHAFFGHRGHPWRELLARGANVAVGTDSRASNPDLSVWNELQYLRRTNPDVDPRMLLELGTHSGARALGLDDLTGTLSPGKSADLAVIGLPDTSSNDPHELLFDGRTRVVATMCAGQWFDCNSATNG